MVVNCQAVRELSEMAFSRNKLGLPQVSCADVPSDRTCAEAALRRSYRDFVFCKPNGEPLHPDVLRKDVLYPTLDRLGITRSSRASGFHTFRHSAASFINAQTGNLKLAQKLQGHSTIDMTAEVYTHTSAEAEREAALALERAIYGDLFPNLFPIGNNSSVGAVN